MDRETLLSWLALAERHIGESACHLLQQRELLARLKSQGLSKSATAATARELLDTIERVQARRETARGVTEAEPRTLRLFGSLALYSACGTSLSQLCAIFS
jgi:hypothetical protein